MTLLQTTTPEFQNATSGFADASGLVPTIAIVLILILIGIGLVSSARFYRMVLNASGAFARSVEYAIKGVATSAVILVFAAPVYLFSQLEPGSRTMVYKAIGGLVVGYVLLVALGVIGDHVWARIKHQHEAATGEKLLASDDQAETQN